MVVFNHIIKTGGMAVIANVAHCNPELKMLNRDAPFLTDSREPYPDDLCDFLHGHFAYEKIPPGTVRFTFARHPIARLSSCFYSLRQELRKHGITSIKDLPAPSVRLGFAGGISMIFRKEQVWFLDRIEDFIDAFLRTGGTFNLNFIPEIFTPDYNRHYDFIGITEKMGQSIAKLGGLIKTDASAMTIVNLSNSGLIRYRLTELTEFFGEEIETYNRLCAKF
jgi:hypothetical protein